MRYYLQAMSDIRNGSQAIHWKLGPVQVISKAYHWIDKTPMAQVTFQRGKRTKRDWVNLQDLYIIRDDPVDPSATP